MSGSGGGRAYQPGLGQFVSPMAAGMSGGAPYSYGNGDPVNDDPLEGVDEDGRPLPYQPMRNSLHNGAGQAAAALNFIAGFNPLCETFAIVQGRDARGCQLSPWDRGLRLLAMAVPYTRVPRINFLRGMRLRLGAGRGPLTPGQLVPRALRDLAEAAFDDAARLADMTPEQREAAARGYEAIAQIAGGGRAEVARLYNLERARFLRGEVERIPPNAYDFGIEKGLIPPRR